ncbi:MAG TPA: alpha-acetolactate decarboxylase [Lachnospiraceae bacterium]|nr:alpha-acetolactate decarboxylase [Lachnospiraceae bacterium]
MNKIFQVSTVKALEAGYLKPIINVEELLCHGDTGIGMFENADGEMVIIDGKCYRLKDDGNSERVNVKSGVTFASIAYMNLYRQFAFSAVDGLKKLESDLSVEVEENFGLNSIHMARIDGLFERITVNSQSAVLTHHIPLSESEAGTRKTYEYENMKGSLICVYFPDYLQGINDPGWHIHFLNWNHSLGGHVTDLKMKYADVNLVKLNAIETWLPHDAAYDTYSLTD